MVRKVFLFFSLIAISVECISQTDTVVVCEKGAQVCHGKIINGQKIGEWICHNISDSCCIILKNYYSVDSLTITEICKCENETSETFFGSCYEYSDDSIVYNGIMTYTSSKYNCYQESYYKQNQKTGQWKFFSQTGNIRFINSIDSYKDDKRFGSSIVFNKRNNISGIYYYVSGVQDGPFTLFFLNNRIDEHGFRKNGVNFGICYKFWENGNLKCMGSYSGKAIVITKSGRYEYNNGDPADDSLSKEIIRVYKSLPTYKYNCDLILKNGIWKYWDENGVLLREEYYNDNGTYNKSVVF